MEEVHFPDPMCNLNKGLIFCLSRAQTNSGVRGIKGRRMFSGQDSLVFQHTLKETSPTVRRLENRLFKGLEKGGESY